RAHAAGVSGAVFLDGKVAQDFTSGIPILVFPGLHGACRKAGCCGLDRFAFYLVYCRVAAEGDRSQQKNWTSVVGFVSARPASVVAATAFYDLWRLAGRSAVVGSATVV